MSEKKSDKLSKQYRNEGNLYYAKKEHFNAIVSYNKSLCYAVSSENLALAYGNRSAMYFELKRYQKCLENIKWARESDYPAEKVQKLNEREEKCKKMLEIEAEFDASSFIKLSYPANPKIPFIVECLEVRTTEEFGRGIYTKQDLMPGDIVAFDKPVFHTVNSTSQYICCCNCLKYQMQSLIPCLKTASLMFCTVKCRDKAYASFPDISSMLPVSEGQNAFPIQVSRLLAQAENALPIQANRLLAQAENAFNGHDNLMKYLKTNEYKNSKETIFDYDLSDPNDPSYEMNRMKAVFSLMSRVHDCYHDGVQNVCKEVAKGDNYLEGFLKHVFGNIIRNGYSLVSVFIILPLGSLFNHSCIANISILDYGDTGVFHVIRPVKAGEQLLTNYFGGHCYTLLERQKLLQESYHFVCRCVYCIKNINFEEISTSVSMAHLMTIVKSSRFYGLHPLTPYKDLSVELLKQLKENQEMIIKNANNPYSLELYALPDCNNALFLVLGNMMNFPCLPREPLSLNVRL